MSKTQVNTYLMTNMSSNSGHKFVSSKIWFTLFNFVLPLIKYWAFVDILTSSLVSNYWSRDICSLDKLNCVVPTVSAALLKPLAICFFPLHVIQLLLHVSKSLDRCTFEKDHKNVQEHHYNRSNQDLKQRLGKLKTINWEK